MAATRDSFSITFRGTAKEGLEVTDHRSFTNVVNNIDELIRGTDPYKDTFVGDPYRNDDNEDGSDTRIPKVVLIRGTDIDSFQHSSVLRTNYGLVGIALTAWNTHRSLILKPDDIWIAILAQFSSYVNARAEELRSKIVEFEGQKKLEVRAPGTIYTADFGSMNQVFLDKISENIKDSSLKDWFLPGFTTTTKNDEVCAAAMAMCSFQAYFKYHFSLGCGLPEVTLNGSVEDWEKLRDKVDRLLEFDDSDQTLSKVWVPKLQIVLDNFVESSKTGSQTNLEFWDSIVSVTTRNVVCATEPDKVTGWISVFALFNQDGELHADTSKGFWPHVRLDDLPHSIATCPATIDDNGTPYNATLFVGQMGFDMLQQPEGVTRIPDAIGPISGDNATVLLVQPRNDWGLVITDGFEKITEPEDGWYEEEAMGEGTITFGRFACKAASLYDPFAPSNRSSLKWIIPGVVVGILVVVISVRKYLFFKRMPSRGTYSGKDMEKNEAGAPQVVNK